MRRKVDNKKVDEGAVLDTLSNRLNIIYDAIKKQSSVYPPEQIMAFAMSRVVGTFNGGDNILKGVFNPVISEIWDKLNKVAGYKEQLVETLERMVGITKTNSPELEASKRLKHDNIKPLGESEDAGQNDTVLDDVTYNELYRMTPSEFSDLYHRYYEESDEVGIKKLREFCGHILECNGMVLSTSDACISNGAKCFDGIIIMSSDKNTDRICYLKISVIGDELQVEPVGDGVIVDGYNKLLESLFYGMCNNKADGISSMRRCNDVEIEFIDHVLDRICDARKAVDGTVKINNN